MKHYSSRIIPIGLAVLLFSAAPAACLASTTQGTIDPAHNYAWGENLGWLNFAASGSNVAVTDAGLTGFVWSQAYGWINLSPSGWGVKNDGQGNLSGFAWGQDVGWIDFSGATISASGKFAGTIGDASSTAGRISFGCAHCDVETDWRPQSVRGGGASVGVASGYGSPYIPGVGIVASSTPTSTPSIPSAEPTSSPASGTGGTGSTNADLLARLNTLRALLVQLIAEAQREGIALPSSTLALVGESPAGTVAPSATSSVFTRNLSLGSTGADVRALQKFLVAQNKGPAARALKAHGFTNNFATLTRAALAELQKSVGIAPASGFFGPVTRAYVIAHDSM